MPLINRKRVLLAKIETTYGTDPIPTGAANAILLRNLTVTPQESDLADRDLIRPYLGASDQLQTAVRAKVDFEVELASSGVLGTAPAVGPLLRACGMSETVAASTTVTYKPVSAAFESVTIYLNVDGVLHKLTGARGTFKVELNNKQIPVFMFSMTGIYNAVTDTAAPVPVYTGFMTPMAVNNLNTSAFTILGYAATLASLSIDLGNDTVHRTLVGGTEQVLITNRKTTGSIQIEAVTVAAKDFWTAAKAGTTGALSILHGTTAGNRVQIDAPNIDINKPNYADLDGIAMLNMDMTLMPSATGNDELSIVFK
jgi:hypothetical protein